MDPNAAKPDNPNIVNPGLETPVNNISADPLSNLQGAVDAAKEAAAAQTPEGQFATQFGGVVPAADASTVQPEPTQPVETLIQSEPEQTPADKLKQKIADSVDAFLAEVTKEKVAA